MGTTSENRKKCMYNLMGTQNMTEDILTKTVCILEGALNQRHLTSLSDEVDDYEAITPSHFLIGSSESEMFRIYWNVYEGHGQNFKANQMNANRIGKNFRKENIPMRLSRKKTVQGSENTVPRTYFLWLLYPHLFRDKNHLGSILK